MRRADGVYDRVIHLLRPFRVVAFWAACLALVLGVQGAGAVSSAASGDTDGDSASQLAESSVELAAYAPGPPGAIMALDSVDTLYASSYRGWNWAVPDGVSYYADDSDSLTIVTRDSSSETLSLDTIDPSTRTHVGEMRSVSLAGWPLWGGFYAGPDDCFYVLVGRENPNEDDSLDVVAVRRYDRSWRLLGTAYVKGGVTQGLKGIYSPLAFSAPQMVLVGNRLVVHMGRLRYMSDDGLRHQMNLTFEVDVDSMTATVFSELGGYSYSSHSFRQMVAMSGDRLVMIDHGDAYPRAIQMGVMADYPSQRQVLKYNLFEFNGAIGDNFTGASVTGLASGPSGVVIVGNSIPHPNAPNGTLDYDGIRNIYSIWADPATGNHTVSWLTDFDSEDGCRIGEPRIVQLGTDRYAVMFTVTTVHTDGSGELIADGHSMEYRLLDSTGSVLAEASFPTASFCAGSDPILIGGRLYWAGIEPDAYVGESVYLLALDVSDPRDPVFLAQSDAVDLPDGFFSVAGANRYSTAVEASKRAYPGGAETVVIATGANWPDALGGAALAGVVDGPLLLTGTDALPDTVLAEVKRLGATKAYVLGGTAAVSSAVEGTLRANMSGDVSRLAGANRYSTADLVASEVIRLQGSAYDHDAFIATGENFPDALGASPLAASGGAPILLVRWNGTPHLPSAVEQVTILGGTGAVSDVTESATYAALGTSEITRVGGADRYDTAAKIAEFGVAHGMRWDGVGIATGAAFPDALSGGAMLGSFDSVLLLTRPTSLVPVAEQRLSANKGSIDTVFFIGGTGAVSQGVRDKVAQVLE